MPDQKDHHKIAAFYDHVYHKDATAVSCPDSHLRNLVRRLNVGLGQKIADIGCGTGDWLSECVRVGAQVAGIDISKTAVDICNKRIPSGEFHCGPAETLPFADGSFDWVTCLGSLEHFLDQPKALQEIVRIAKPTAGVLILVPNSGFLTHRLGLYRGTQQQQIRETIRSLDDWSSMFAQSGLVVEERWRDLHMANWRWISKPPFAMAPLRALQLAALACWPLAWQYQVYHLCRLSGSPNK